MIDARLAGEALSFSYDGTAVLSAVDVEVGRGELVGLIGPNGAGKTTLVRVLAGLTRPDQGRVVLGDRPIDEWSRRERARLIALVPQDPRVEFSFTVLEVVLMGRAPHLTGLGFAGPDDVRRARAALARLDLAELEARRLDTLSGGERQRVFLARALAQDPTILLLDEPTTHLDLRHQTEILDIVREGVRERGLAALAVLHDLNLAAVACDRLVLLAAGRVVKAGSPHDVLTRELIERAFATPVHVRRHDLADTPAILPMPRR